MFLGNDKFFYIFATFFAVSLYNTTVDHFLSLIKFRVAVGLEPILAVIGEEVQYTLDANSVYCRADT